MEKAKLTKEQAEAIESALSDKSCAEVVMIHADKIDFWAGAKVTPLNDLDLNTLIIALYIGYEVELTEQEKIQDLYDCFMARHHGFYRLGVRDTLTVLGREDLIPKEEKA
jgi:hypothetical protein